MLYIVEDILQHVQNKPITPLTKFVHFILGPYTEYNKNNHDEYPLFSEYLDNNPFYPVQYVRNCFNQGLKISDTFQGNSLLHILVVSLLASNSSIEYSGEVDSLLDMCMDKKEFQNILNSFLVFDEEEDIEDMNNNVKGYLMQYAKKNKIAFNDAILKKYSPIHWEENSNKNPKNIFFSDLKYWSEYEFDHEDDEDEENGFGLVDCDRFYLINEIENAKKEIVNEISKENDEDIDFAKMMSLIKKYSLNPSEVSTVNGRTILMDASRLNKIEIVRELLEMDGIDIDEEDAYGWTPVMYAKDAKASDTILNMLKQKGFNMEEEEYGETSDGDEKEEDEESETSLSEEDGKKEIMLNIINGKRYTVDTKLLKNLAKDFKKNNGFLADNEYLAGWYYDVMEDTMDDLITNYLDTFYDNLTLPERLELYHQMMNTYYDKKEIEERVMQVIKTCL
jgi:hypothetical protein